MTYINAEMELVAFAAEDVLATSNGSSEPSVETTAKPVCRTHNPELPPDEF